MYTVGLDVASPTGDVGSGAHIARSEFWETGLKRRTESVGRNHLRAASAPLTRARRKRRIVVHWGGPGREGPALDGLFVEPRPLDFWKLEKSRALSPRSSPIPYPRALKRLLHHVRGLSLQPLVPRYQYTFLTVITYLIIPSSTLSDLVNEDGKRFCSTRSLCQVHGSLLIVAIVHTARSRYSRSRSPEIPGRIVFFITAVGRSPPSFVKGCVR